MLGFIKRHRELFLYLCTILLSAAAIYGGYLLTGYSAQNQESQEGYPATVEKILDIETENHSLGSSEYDYFSMTITFQAQITSGSKKGETVVVTQSLDSNSGVSPKEVSKGDRIIVSPSVDANKNTEWLFTEYHRSNILIVLCGIFVVLLLIFGRKKGFNTILSLVFTCLAVFVCFIPAVLNGKNIYLWAILTCIYVIGMTLLLVNGWNKKSLVAACGCVGGLFVTGALTVVMDKLLFLTGAVDEQSTYLQMLNQPIELRGVIFAAILIGALGAAMDVSMSLASSLLEVSDNMEHPTFQGLLKSGIKIGQDIMGTMANTLILAYIGCELSTVLLIIASNPSMLILFNMEMIVVELLQSIVGSFGILFTIPATSLLAAFLYTKKGKHKLFSKI